MKEGEPILGGPQANPGATDVPNPGIQPASPIVSQNSVSTPRPTIPPFTRRPQFTSQPQVQPQSVLPTTDDIMLQTTEPKSKPKKNLIISLILASLVIVGILLFFILRPTTYNKELDKETIRSFSTAYTSLIRGYEYEIGLNPRETLDENGDSLARFLLPDSTLEEINNFYKDVSQRFNDLDGASIEYVDPQGEIKNTLKIIGDNLSIINSFSNAFAPQIAAIFTGEIIPESDCKTTNEIDELVNSPEQNISDAAKIFKEGFCNYSQSVYMGEDNDIYNTALFKVANEALMSTLQYIDEGGTGRDELAAKVTEMNLEEEANEEN